MNTIGSEFKLNSSITNVASLAAFDEMVRMNTQEKVPELTDTGPNWKALLRLRLPRFTTGFFRKGDLNFEQG